MKIHLATDHAGFTHKEAVKEYLATQEGMEVLDHGAYVFTDSDDYPDFMKLAAEGVSKDEKSMGVIFGHSGEGEAMVVNRYPAIRAGIFNSDNLEIVKLLREHNNANILSIGAHFVSTDQTIEALKVFLSTPFSNEERHIRRLNKF